jgi:hypothetical protein
MLSFVGDRGEEHTSFFETPYVPVEWWTKCRRYIQLCLDNLEVYRLDEFKSWWLIQYIPIWSMHPANKDNIYHLLKSVVEPFLEENGNIERWRSALIHEKDFYRDVDDATNNILAIDIGGVKSEITIAVMVMHWILLKQFGIDPKDLGFIFEFGGGVGHIPKLVKKLGFDGRYCIYDFPELSAIQQFYNNFGVTTINHTALINPFLNGGGSNGLFYSTWAFSECPVELRARIEPSFNYYKYCFILYQHKCGGVDNVKYFDDMCKRNTNFDWSKIQLEGYKIGDSSYGEGQINTYLIGVNKNYG